MSKFGKFYKKLGKRTGNSFKKAVLYKENKQKRVRYNRWLRRSQKVEDLGTSPANYRKQTRNLYDISDVRFDDMSFLKRKKWNRSNTGEAYVTK